MLPLGHDQGGARSRQAQVTWLRILTSQVNPTQFIHPSGACDAKAWPLPVPGCDSNR